MSGESPQPGTRGCVDCLSRLEPFGQPHLDGRLAGDAEPGLPIDRLNHPLREVHLDPLDADARPVGKARAEVIEDVFARFNFPLKTRRFHTRLPGER